MSVESTLRVDVPVKYTNSEQQSRLVAMDKIGDIKKINHLFLSDWHFWKEEKAQHLNMDFK